MGAETLRVIRGENDHPCGFHKNTQQRHFCQAPNMVLVAVVA